MINLLDPNNGLKWVRIRGYNGYEYNFNHKAVRSLKQYIKYPYGQLVHMYKDNNGAYYMLSNLRNERNKIYITQIEDIIGKDPNSISVYTGTTNLAPRNTVTRNKYLHVDQNDPQYKTHFVDFSKFIVDDE